jgi:hypothetical protein
MAGLFRGAYVESIQELIPITDTNSDSDSDSIVDQPEFERKPWDGLKDYCHPQTASWKAVLAQDSCFEDGSMAWQVRRFLLAFRSKISRS